MEDYKNLSLENIDGEIWEEIDEFDGDYFISNHGRVKSLKFRKEKILKQRKNRPGYLYVRLYRNGKPEDKQIHTLLYESFNNCKLKNNECIHHIDFTKDNRLDNLEKMTKSEHSILHMSGGKHPMFRKHQSEKTKQSMRENHADFKGEKHPQSVLTKQDVIKMKSFWDNNIKISNKLLSKWYKVNPQTISKIKTGKAWTHIKSQSL